MNVHRDQSRLLRRGLHLKPLHWNASLMLATELIRSIWTISASLLDVDGTILDIAATPQGVHVPDELRPTLERLLDRTDGALALVSGRPPIGDLDHISLRRCGCR